MSITETSDCQHCKNDSKVITTPIQPFNFNINRMFKEFKNPFDEYRKNIGQKSQNEETKREELFKKTREMLAKYEANKTNKQLEIEAKEMKCKKQVEQ